MVLFEGCCSSRSLVNSERRTRKHDSFRLKVKYSHVRWMRPHRGLLCRRAPCIYPVSGASKHASQRTVASVHKPSRTSLLSRTRRFRPTIEGLEERTVLSLFNVAPSIFLGNNTAPQSVTGGDFRGNGRLDLAIADHNSNAVSVLLSNGDGTYQTAVNYSLGANMNPSFITSANLNADHGPISWLSTTPLPALSAC